MKGKYQNKKDCHTWGLAPTGADLQLEYLMFFFVFQDKAEPIERAIFYQMEYRDLTFTLMKKYQPGYLSKNYLRDLVK